jgi:hypothetical protein
MQDTKNLQIYNRIKREKTKHKRKKPPLIQQQNVRKCTPAKESLSHNNFSFNRTVGLRSLASLGTLRPNYSYTHREVTREKKTFKPKQADIKAHKLLIGLNFNAHTPVTFSGLGIRSSQIN